MERKYTMKICLSQLNEIYNVYNKLSASILPVDVAYKILKHKQSFLNDIYFFQSEKKKLFDTYLEKDENDHFIQKEKNIFVIKKNKQVEFGEKLKELESLEVSIENVVFSFDELRLFNLSLKEMEILLPFIQEEE